jgi:uncharacterized protein YcbX
VRVQALWRYPVKSLGGEPLESVAVDSLGLAGDRRFGIRDRTTGRVLTARREPSLLFARAELRAQGPVVVLPDGTETDDDRVLSDWLGRAVALERAGDEGGTYETPVDVEHEEGAWSEWQGPGGAWHDSERSRVSLVSTDTLGTQDARRFRPNVVLDGGGEDGLVGSTVALGSTRLAVVKGIRRCVVVTRPQPDLPRDLDVYRSVQQRPGQTLCVGALVVGDGTIGVGDELGPWPS